MWHHVIVTALHLALRNRADARANANANADAAPTPTPKPPSVSAFALLALVMGGCLGCVGLFAVFGTLLTITGEVPAKPGEDPGDALLASCFVCFAPSLLLLVPAIRSIVRTRRAAAAAQLQPADATVGIGSTDVSGAPPAGRLDRVPAPIVSPGATFERTCPFCRTVVTLSSADAKPRCTSCGVPFSTRSLP